MPLAKERTLRALQKSAKEISQILKLKEGKVEIFLASADAMRTMEKIFFRKNKSPDVLSFPEPARFPHPESKQKILGQVYINWDTQKSKPERMIFLLAHGFLHILGYDHLKKSDIINMERMEKKIMGKLRK